MLSTNIHNTSSKLNPGHLAMMATLIISLSGILFGYDTGILAGTLPLVEQQFHLSNVAAGMIVGALALGAATGTIFNIAQKDRLSRRRTLQFATTLFILGALFSASALNYYWLITARFIIGLGIGISSSIAPIYIAEICPATLRGRHVTTNVAFITGGILLAYVIARYLAPLDHWRIMLLVGLLPALLLFHLIWLCPESPRWLVKNNLLHEANDSLKKLSADNSEKTLSHIQQIMRTKQTASFAKLIGIGIVLAFLQQLSGINAILYYAPKIFNTLGNTNLASQLDQAIYIGLANFIATLVSGLISDKVGRRRLFILCFGLMCLSLLTLSLCSKSLSHIMSVSLIISFIFFYGLSIGCLFWVVISEIFPLQWRSSAAAISTMANWLANFLVSFSFLPLLNLIHIQGLFALYGICCLSGAVFSFSVLKETKNLTLEEIETSDNLSTLVANA